MNTSLLVEKLQARGILLSLDNGQLNYTAENPLPAGIVTTLTVEAPRLVRYLESLTLTATLKKQANEPTPLPNPLLDQLGDGAAIFAKVLELFPPAGVVEWTPKAERKKAVSP